MHEDSSRMASVAAAPASWRQSATLAALGVVYGDIGTSPIYAFRQALHASGSSLPTIAREDVLGILSLIVWALFITVSIKYVCFVLRSDNRGEGGILSLMALSRRMNQKYSTAILGLGMVGVGLFFGDAMITPAISVLSAVEGLSIAAPGVEPWVVPITVVILLALFMGQRFGTHRVAAVFAPVMFVWFLALGLSGLVHIWDDPHVLFAVDPFHAIGFFVRAPVTGFVTLGAVFLAVTGAEALYADLGHFGRRPIIRAWFWIVFPCLLANYFGQGAYVLAHDGRIDNPFFEMNAGWALLPFTLLATIATIIASQAVITGAFSAARQAVQLNLLPRTEIRHTSETQEGQIYLPVVNWIIATGVLLLVIWFGDSTRLASAYGISVTGAMLVTSVLMVVVARRIWRWNLALALLLFGFFGLIETAFLSANVLKVVHGGWVSLAIAAVVILLMVTWVRGSRTLYEKTRRTEVPLQEIVDRLNRTPPPLVPGQAVFMSSDPESTPTALLHSLKHYKVLHERNLILTVKTMPEPYLRDDQRVSMEVLNPLFRQAIIRFGYMEKPNVPLALARHEEEGWSFEIMETSFFLSRRTLRRSRISTLPRIQGKIFIAMSAFATNASAYYAIPADRVVDIGTQVGI